MTSGWSQLYGLTFTASGLALMAAIPISGRAVDRVGARRLLPPILLLFAGGLIVCATAVAMPMVLVGQFLAGAGGGGLYALSLGTIAKTYPDNQRPRVMALLATMWILPGLLGPPLGAAHRQHHRMARGVPRARSRSCSSVGRSSRRRSTWCRCPRPDPRPGRWPCDGRCSSCSAPGCSSPPSRSYEPWAVAMAGVGLLIGWPALARIVPAVARSAPVPGLPAAAMAAFLLSVGFLAFDGFLTLMLTDIRALSLGEASIAVTAATLTWAAGSLWQSGRADRIALGRLVMLGGRLSLVGGVLRGGDAHPDRPRRRAFAGWALVGLGMGIAFPTIPLSAMRVVVRGRGVGRALVGPALDVIGVATGAGLGGGAIAVSDAIGAPLASGIAWSFAIGAVAFLALVVWAGPTDPRRSDHGAIVMPSRRSRGRSGPVTAAAILILSPSPARGRSSPCRRRQGRPPRPRL